MYICLCCGLTDTQMAEAVAKGADSVAEVFRHFGETQQCELCTVDVMAVLQITPRPQASADAAADGAAAPVAAPIPRTTDP